MKGLIVAVVLVGLRLGLGVGLALGLGAGPALACDEECSPGFVFDDSLGTCVRVATS